MKKILLVEDDTSLGQTLCDRLEQDYLVIWCKSAQTALECIQSEGVQLDLAILDVGLPDKSGFSLAQEIKQKIQNLPFLFLTAQADAESRLKGFELGAEEYIPKPFLLKELLLRVAHIFDKHPVSKEIHFPHFVINFTHLSIQFNNGKIEYPAATDMKILQTLIEKAPQVLSRDDIVNAVWGEDKNPNFRTIDNSIARLRNILGPDGDQWIRSIRGIGYQWSTSHEGDSK